MLDLLDLPARRPTWMRRAACRGLDPELFMPEDGPAAHLVPHEALAVCSDCPVRPECLEYALDRDEPGAWGGLTRKQRRLLRSRRRAEAS